MSQVREPGTGGEVFRNPKRRLARLLAAWAALWGMPSGWIWGALALGGGYSLGYTIWVVLHRSLADEMIAGRRAYPRDAPALAGFVGLGLLLVGLSWVGLAHRRAVRGGSLQAGFAQGARWLGALNLLLPLLCAYWLARNRQWRPLTTVAMVGVSLALVGFLRSYGVRGRWEAWVRARFSWRWMLVIALLFCVGVGWVGILRHRSFNSSALDMAMMDQLVWNTSRGRVLQGTFSAIEVSNYLGNHFSPILAALAPLYWVVPYPETLIVVQAVAIALSALALYALGVRVTGRRWMSACLVLSFVLNPALHDGALFDFHQDALGMLFLAGGLLCIAHKRWGWAGVCWLLSLSCKEELAVYWAAIALFNLVRDGKRRWVWAAFAGVNVGWLLIVVRLIIPAFQTRADHSFLFLDRYRAFGGTPAEWVRTCVTNPVYVLRHLLTPERIAGLVVLMLPVFFLVWRGLPEVSILLVPLAINFLSDLELQHRFSLHYSMLPLAMVYAAAIYGARVWSSRHRSRERRLSVSLQYQEAYLLVAALALYVLFSPLGGELGDTIRDFQVDAHDEIGTRLVRTLPAEATIVAQSPLAPHLSQRESITLFPRTLARPPDYYLFDVTGNLYPLSPERYDQAVSEVLQDPDYGPVFVQDGYILLEHYAGRERVAEAAAMLEAMGPLAAE